MNTVTPIELAKRILELLGLREGETIELARLRSGDLLVRKAIQGQGDQ